MKRELQTLDARIEEAETPEESVKLQRERAFSIKTPKTNAYRQLIRILKQRIEDADSAEEAARLDRRLEHVHRLLRCELRRLSLEH